MAIPTHFDITFTCGHTEKRDLSAKPAGKRKTFAKWLSHNGECIRCWKENHKDERRLQQMQIAESNAQKLDLPQLDGSKSQLEWAPIFRNDLIIQAHSDLTEGEDAPMSDDEFEERIMVPARKITRAGWWMDNSDSESEDLEELVTTALSTPTDTTENPY